MQTELLIITTLTKALSMFLQCLKVTETQTLVIKIAQTSLQSYLLTYCVDYSWHTSKVTVLYNALQTVTCAYINTEHNTHCTEINLCLK